MLAVFLVPAACWSQPSAAGDCFPLQKIEVGGADLFPPAAFRAVTDPYLGRCLQPADLERLLGELTGFYYERGYITSRAYLRPQELADGSLQVTVLEGRIQRFEAPSGSEAFRKSLRAAFPAGAGEPLNLRDLEQGLVNLHRLRSNSVSLVLEPGDAPGDTIVVLQNRGTSPWHLAAGADNHGQQSTGHLQGYLALGVDNPLALADYLSVSISGNLEKHRQDGNGSLNLSYELPYGNWLARFSHGSSEYQSRVQGVGEPFTTSGDARVSSLSLQRLCYRDQAAKLFLRLELTHRSNENFLEDILLHSSSRRLTVASLGLTWQRSLAAGFVSLRSDWSRGLALFHALEDDPLAAPGTPQAQFDKLTAACDLVLAPLERLPRLRYALEARLQASADPLYGSEQLILGGYYSIRGYRDDGLAGDSGGLLRQEVSFAFDGPGGLSGATLTPFVALDVGAVRAKPAAEAAWGSLAGAGGGVRLRYGGAQAELFWGEPVAPPAAVRDDSGILYANLQWQF